MTALPSRVHTYLTVTAKVIEKKVCCGCFQTVGHLVLGNGIRVVSHVVAKRHNYLRQYYRIICLYDRLRQMFFNLTICQSVHGVAVVSSFPKSFDLLGMHRRHLREGQNTPEKPPLQSPRSHHLSPCSPVFQAKQMDKLIVLSIQFWPGDAGICDGSRKEIRTAEKIVRPLTG